MADLVVTASQVKKASNSVMDSGANGAALVAGEVVYKDAEDGNKVKLADCNVAGPDYEAAGALGIMVNSCPGTSGQEADYVAEGDVELGAGAAMTVGTPYFLSPNAGKLCPLADIPAGGAAVVTYVGTAKTASVLSVKIHRTGVLKP